MVPRQVVADSLRYAEPAALRQPVRFRVIGSISIAAGCAGVAINLLIAAGMGNQLFKQWGGVRGVSRLPFVEAWLMLTGAEAVLSAGLGVFAIVMGAVMLRRPGRGPRLHRWYAWMKLGLACGFGVWAGWATVFYVSRDPAVVGAAGALAMIGSAAYPVILLRMFPPAGREAAYE